MYQSKTSCPQHQETQKKRNFGWPEFSTFYVKHMIGQFIFHITDYISMRILKAVLLLGLIPG